MFGVGTAVLGLRGLSCRFASISRVSRYAIIARSIGGRSEETASPDARATTEFTKLRFNATPASA
jgi:hypothetical protein